MTGHILRDTIVELRDAARQQWAIKYEWDYLLTAAADEIEELRRKLVEYQAGTVPASQGTPATSILAG